MRRNAACFGLSVVTYRHVPLVAYALDRPPETIAPEPTADAIVLPRSARAAESLQSASDTAALLLAPPPGYDLRAQSRDWALAVRRGSSVASSSGAPCP